MPSDLPSFPREFIVCKKDKISNRRPKDHHCLYVENFVSYKKKMFRSCLLAVKNWSDNKITIPETQFYIVCKKMK